MVLIYQLITLLLLCGVDISVDNHGGGAVLKKQVLVAVVYPLQLLCVTVRVGERGGGEGRLCV